jgi:WD40 repeat protein
MRWHQNDSSFKINSIDWNSMGDHLIVSSDDKTMRIFDILGQELCCIPSKKHGCDLVQFMTDGNTAIFASKYDSNIGSDFHKIRHLDLHRKQFIHYYCGHENQVYL